LYKRVSRIVSIMLISMLFGGTIYACTLWSATGDVVIGRDTLIAKNRDWLPDQQTELCLVTPQSGYRYLALNVAGQDEEAGTRGGINECGLVVISATAGSIPSSERKSFKVMPHHLIATILRECKTVDDVLSQADSFRGPKILMIADHNKIAYIEIGPDNVAVKSSTNGILYHTNHYVEDALLAANENIGKSSQVRYLRIKELLKDANLPLTMKDFIAFSNDRAENNPDYCIKRIGIGGHAEKTVATFIVDLPRTGSPVVYLELDNPGAETKNYNIVVDDVFNGKANEIYQ